MCALSLQSFFANTIYLNGLTGTAVQSVPSANHAVRGSCKHRQSETGTLGHFHEKAHQTIRTRIFVTWQHGYFHATLQRTAILGDPDEQVKTNCAARFIYVQLVQWNQINDTQLNGCPVCFCFFIGFFRKINASPFVWSVVIKA